MKKSTQVKTKRMILSPMSVEELQVKIKDSSDPELAQAYREMLAGCEKNPRDLVWNAPWKMILKSSQKYIGDIGFKGAPQKGRVEIGYGLEKEFEGRGLMTEAASAMVEWAFGQENVYIVEAETEPDNFASQRILEKLKFVPAGIGAEGPRFQKEKQMPAWMAIYMCLGLSIGTSIGSLSGKQSIGMSMGIGIGMALGAAMDSMERKRRRDIME